MDNPKHSRNLKHKKNELEIKKTDDSVFKTKEKKKKNHFEKFKTVLLKNKELTFFFIVKLGLAFVDYYIYENLFMNSMRATPVYARIIAFMYAALTTILPLLLAVTLKVHQEKIKEPRMKKASRNVLCLTIFAAIITLGLLSYQRWTDININAMASIERFEDEVRNGAIDFDILAYGFLEEERSNVRINPRLEELSNGVSLRNYWHIHRIGSHDTVVFGRHQAFIGEFALLILPIVLFIVTFLASYFFTPEKTFDEWYAKLETISERKKKELLKIQEELEVAKKEYEAALFEYQEAIRARDIEMTQLRIPLGLENKDIGPDILSFENACREVIRKNAFKTVENSYEISLNSLHSWIQNDIELYKNKIATHHEEMVTQHAILKIDLLQIIEEYNNSVPPLKQFGTEAKTAILLEYLKEINEEITIPV